SADVCSCDLDSEAKVAQTIADGRRAFRAPGDREVRTIPGDQMIQPLDQIAELGFARLIELHDLASPTRLVTAALYSGPTRVEMSHPSSSLPVSNAGALGAWRFEIGRAHV